MNLKPGDILADRHRLDATLGEGGFGVVFRGTTIESGRPVAIKVLKLARTKGSDVHVARFMRELRVIAKLQSPHTPTLFDYGKTPDGVPFMVLEFVDGEDLSELLRRVGPLGEPHTVTLLLQALDSLAEAHALGVLHRDIKPANLRVSDPLGPNMRLRVLDFGLARSFEFNDGVTAEGKVIGTPRYMAPEQILGGTLTPATDIFSLGLVAYEMLMGRAATALEVRRPGSGLRVSVADPVSTPLREIVNRMLEPDPALRFPTANAVIAALRATRSSDLRLPPPVHVHATTPVPPAELLPVLVELPPRVRRSHTTASESVEQPAAAAAPARRGSPVLVAAVLAMTCFALALVEFESRRDAAAPAPTTEAPRLTVPTGSVEGRKAGKISFDPVDDAVAARAFEEGQEALRRRDWSTALHRFLLVEEHPTTAEARRLAGEGQLTETARGLLELPVRATALADLRRLGERFAGDPELAPRIAMRHALVGADELATHVTRRANPRAKPRRSLPPGPQTPQAAEARPRRIVIESAIPKESASDKLTRKVNKYLEP